LVYVTTTLPELEAVKTPVEALIEPTAEDGTVQLPPAGLAVKLIEPPLQASVTVEVIDGAALTTKLATEEQPLLFVKVIVVVPVDNGVTSPVLLTVAIAVLLEVHGLLEAGVPVAVNVSVLPSAIPVNVPESTGFAYTVTLYVSSQPVDIV
jgi:hypothetical protein